MHTHIFFKFLMHSFVILGQLYKVNICTYPNKLTLESVSKLQ